MGYQNATSSKAEKDKDAAVCRNPLFKLADPANRRHRSATSLQSDIVLIIYDFKTDILS